MRIPWPRRCVIVAGGISLSLSADAFAFTAPSLSHFSGPPPVRLQGSADNKDPAADVAVADGGLGSQNDESAGAFSYDPDCAQKFKVVTCSATSCAKKRQVLGLDEYATFASFWERVQDGIPEMQVEETSCLGSCKKAPCVAIEHAEYEGTVALEGMDAFEFSDRVFHRVIDQGDVERVWDCVQNAVQVMSEGGYDDDDCD